MYICFICIYAYRFRHKYIYVDIHRHDGTHKALGGDSWCFLIIEALS